MRQYVARPPTQPLAKFAEYLWASQGAPPHAKERVVPTGTLELAFTLVDRNDRVDRADEIWLFQRITFPGSAGRELSKLGGAAGWYALDAQLNPNWS